MDGPPTWDEWLHALALTGIIVVLALAVLSIVLWRAIVAQQKRAGRRGAPYVRNGVASRPRAAA